MNGNMSPKKPRAPGHRYVRVVEILGDAKQGIKPLLPMSRSMWWEWVRLGKAPQPIRFGCRCSVWKLSDVLGFIERQRQESR